VRRLRKRNLIKTPEQAVALFDPFDVKRLEVGPVKDCLEGRLYKYKLNFAGEELIGNYYAGFYEILDDWLKLCLTRDLLIPNKLDYKGLVLCITDPSHAESIKWRQSKAAIEFVNANFVPNRWNILRFIIKKAATVESVFDFSKPDLTSSYRAYRFLYSTHFYDELLELVEKEEQNDES
jgi:hypothetical protein